MSAPVIRTPERKVEGAWFSALCSDDYEFLGVPDGRLRSSYEHCGDIVRKADALGYQNILLPSGWIAGQDALSFAAAMAPQTQQINQLAALRMGEVLPNASAWCAAKANRRRVVTMASGPPVCASWPRRASAKSAPCRWVRCSRYDRWSDQIAMATT